MIRPMDVWLRRPNNLEASTPIITVLEPAKRFWFDCNFAWSSVDPNDSAPFCFSTYQPIRICPELRQP
jgi:hypothetical protein